MSAVQRVLYRSDYQQCGNAPIRLRYWDSVPPNRYRVERGGIHVRIDLHLSSDWYWYSKCV